MRMIPGRFVARALVGLLALAALIQFGYHGALGLAVRDVAPYETILAQAVAGHFEAGAGPERFYGPFDGGHPSVLIHAPLYYRLVALAAWPLVALGCDPLPAVLIAGRGLSALGALLLFFAVYQIGRLAEGSTRAGVLAALLVASSAVFGVLAVMVRPDTLGVALQTLGCWLVLRRLDERKDARFGLGSLTGAAVSFALAFCMKQQNLTVPVVASIWLTLAAWRGHVRVRELACAAVAGAIVVAADLAAENLVTHGRMWQSVYAYPGGAFRAINYAGWAHVVSVVGTSFKRSLGLVLLMLAAAWLARGRRGSAVLERRVATLLLVELVSLVPLCLYNQGAASNYALQAVVFTAILAGWLIDRALEVIAQSAGSRLALRVIPIAVAAGVLGISNLYWIAQTASIRDRAHLAFAEFARDAAINAVPPSGRYFVSHQDLNRISGRADLIHDYWLYGAFERIEAAEPRQHWLRSSLVEGPIVQVVAPDASVEIPGIRETLPELGYIRVAQHGDLTVWQRADSAVR